MEFSQHNQDNHNSKIFVNDAAAVERHKRLLRSGQIWLCAGLGLMGLSFALNMLFHSEGQSIMVAMYALTTVGIACIMKCLVNIFN